MQYRKLGRSGLEVSPIAFGTLTFGTPGEGYYPWTLGLDDSRPFMRHALELGINFFDMANVYSNGRTEEITGQLIRELANRDEVVIATKMGGPMHSGPNASGSSRKTIMTEIDHTLRRLQTDYVDLYQIHRLDQTVPVEEILEALHDVVKMGKARYIGASSMYAWEFTKLLYTADLHGWTRFISMQNHYNLINREEEREMIPLCNDQGIGILPWSPLARGRLARAWDDVTARSELDVVGRRFYGADRQHVAADADREIIDRIGKVAAARGVSRAQVALAWVLSKPGVVAPIIGATKLDHFDDAVAAVDLVLDDAEIATLEEPYVPHSVPSFWRSPDPDEG